MNERNCFSTQRIQMLNNQLDNRDLSNIKEEDMIILKLSFIQKYLSKYYVKILENIELIRTMAPL
jgi:hypothetical protein